MANESANANETSNTLTTSEGNEVTVKLIDGVCVVTTEDATASLTAPIIIEKPDAGETVQLDVVPGQKYFFDFNENNVQSFVQDGDDLTLNFADGSSILLQGFGTAASGVLPATLAFSDALSADELEGLIQVVDTTPDQEELEDPQSEIREEEETASTEDTSGDSEGQQVAAVEPASGQPSGADVAQIEPAAGDDAAGGNENTGFGFGSSFDPQGVIPLEDVGPIGPTALQFDLPEFAEDLFLEELANELPPEDDDPIIFSPDALSLDESFLGPLSVSDTLVVDYGADGPGASGITPDGSPVVVSGSSTGGATLLSNGNVVDIQPTANGYVGTINGGADTVFTLTIDPQSGFYEFTQLLAIDHADGTNPDDVITLTFGVQAEDSDGDVATAEIVINVADAAPTADNATSVVDETDLPGGAIVNGVVPVDFSSDGPGAVTPNGTNLFNSSGSQLGGNLTSGGQLVDVNLVGGNVYEGTINGGADTIFTLTLNPDGSYTFQLLGPLDHADPNDPNDIINLEFGVIATDFDGDETEAIITVQVKDDVPVIGDSRGDVDETNLDGGPISTSDTLPTSFGTELNTIGPDGAIATEAGGNPITLLSGGQPVDIQPTADGYVGTINGGADTVFEITINPATAQYTYTQFAPFDHPDATDANDIIELSFGVVITNNDGDSDNGTITINVADDGPIANDDVTGAEEGQVITGDVTANDDFSEDTPNTVTEVEFGGSTFTIPAGGNSGPIVTPLGTLVLNSDGTYEFTATDVGDPDGTAVFTYTLTGFDGDSDTATLSVRVTPDGEPIAVTDSMTVDETNLTPGPLVINETLPVDFGLDGPGTINPNGTTSFGGSVLGGNLTSGGQQVDVVQTADGYEGVIQGTTVQVFELIVQDNGDYSFELFQTLDHADSTDPNDLIQLNFGITVADADNDTAEGTITINVLDDAPVAFDDGNTVLQNTLVANGNVVTNDIQGEDTPSTVTSITCGATTIPVVGPTVINGDYGVLTINPDGTYEYVSNGTNINTETDEFTYTLTDFDGDSDTAELTITIEDIDVRPEINAGFEVVDETDLPGVQESGQLVVDYGVDGPGEVTPDTNNLFDSSGSRLNDALTSGGEPVTVALDPNDPTTFVGETPNGDVIFTLQVNPDGSYTFDLLGTLDHADPNDPNDIINLEFGVVATDADGDQTPTTITVLVKDDVPTIGNQFGDVDESDLENGPISTSDTLFTDFGTEATSFTPVPGGVRAEVGGNPITLTAGGETVTLVQTPNGYEGTTPSNGTVFTLVMDPVTGQYVYTQTAPFDHPDGTDPNDTIELLFDFTVENADGDTDTGTVVVSVADDGPIANDDVNGAAEGQDITGSVTANDDFSEDNPNTVTQVEFGGNTFIIPDGGNSGPIVTPLGTFILNSDGSYEFDAVDSGDPDGTVEFTYTLVDSDGDSDTATLSIRVTPDGEPIIVSGENIVDETALTPGPLVINESLDVDFGLDGAGSVDPNGISSFGGSVAAGNLTSNDVQVVIQATANGYEGVLQGTTTQVFELIIQDNGDYSFELFGPLDHADGSDPNDAIQLNFGVTATDFGGDAATATITINVLDDAPIANDDVNMYDTNAGVANGNVITGLNGGPGAADDLSEDNAAPESADHDVVQVSFNGTTVDIPAGGSNTIAGDFGTLTMFDDGTYTYELNPGVILPGMSMNVLDPQPGDVAGTQETFTKNGITVSTVNGGDLTFTDDGIGINDGSGSNRVFGNDEALNVGFANADQVTLTMGDLGNNPGSAMDFVIYLSDGSTRTVEVPVADIPLTNSAGSVTFNASDYGPGLTITGVDVFSHNTNSNFGKTSFSLVEVKTIHAGDDCIADEFEYVLQDGDGDQSTATLTLKGKDLINDKPKLETSEVMVDETDLDPTDDASNSITADFGADVPGSYALVDLDSFNGAENNQLTSNGVDVLVTNEAGDLVGRANGNEVFRLELNETTGAYTFTLTGTLDHADETNPDDVIQLFFNVTATDADGDTDSGVITVNVKDDGPFINTKFKPIDEDGLVDGAISLTNTLNHSYGEDGPGEIRPTGIFSAHFQVGGQNQTLTANGVEILVNATADGYEGVTTNGDTVFTLVVQDNGQYTYTQFTGIDHPDASNPDDVIWLKFEVEIVDFDGDTDTAIIGIDVHDGGPQAHDDEEHFGICDDQGFIAGDVIANDEVGPDVPGSITQVAFGGQTVGVDAANGATIDGDYGQLQINADGTYEYQLFNVPGSTQDQTVYTFSKDNPPGSDNGGDIKNVTTSYNEDTEELEFSLTVEDISEGFTVAINNGPNPKGHGGEMALIYFDASGVQPVVSVYAYNGLNTLTSWMDGSAAAGTQAPDQILNSIADAGLFSNIEVIDNGDGTKTFNLAMDASTIQSHDPVYGPDGEWTGVSFQNEIGIWLHPVQGLDTSYDQDGFLTQWDIHGQGWYDTSHQPTEIKIIKGHDCAVCEKELNPVKADVHGIQESLTKDGITISVANDGDFDLVWRDDAPLGSGLGIDNLNSNDSTKVWPRGETFDISIDQAASEVGITIAELGDNNNFGQHGVDYIITFADGSTQAGEQQFVPGEINGGMFTFTLNATDFGGRLITDIALNSTDAGQYKGASFLLNNVTANCPDHKQTVDVFEYTLADADGDTSVATLTLQGDTPKTIVGSDGDDIIAGGGDSDTLYGGAGADTFLYESITEGVDTIQDFDASEGDVLDVSALLQGFDVLQDSINDFVFATEAAGDTTIAVDPNGSGNVANATQIAVLEAVTGLNIEDATNNGQTTV